MKTVTWTFLILGLLLNVAVWWATEVKGHEDWQLRRLHDPTDRELLVERQGRVIIYDGLKDNQVEEAMDAEYDRIENMMFIRTVVTNSRGEPLRDSQSGELIVEDDDCD